MKLVDRYLARAMATGTALVMVVLLALSGFVQFIGEFDAVGQGEYDLATAAVYVLMGLPQQAYEMFPVAALLGSLLGLGGLASHNELVVLRTSGFSMFRLGGSALFGGVLLAGVAVGFGEFVAPKAEQGSETLRARALYDQLSLTGPEGLWARDGELFINIQRMPERGQLQGIFIYRVGEDDRLTLAGHAERAEFHGGTWHLEGVQETRFSEGEAEAIQAPRTAWSTRLDPELLNLFVIDPELLSIAGLYRYVDYLQRNELDSYRYRLAMWMRVVTPVSILVMVVLALPFVFGPLRSAGVGQRLMVGVLVGVVFYIANRTVANSGAVFGLPATFTAWFPTLVLTLVAVAGLRRIR